RRPGGEVVSETAPPRARRDQVGRWWILLPESSGERRSGLFLSIRTASADGSGRRTEFPCRISIRHEESHPLAQQNSVDGTLRFGQSKVRIPAQQVVEPNFIQPGIPFLNRDANHHESPTKKTTGRGTRPGFAPVVLTPP